jgi:2-iminobutanoate/2-iminopropanoate deaminase
MEARKEFIMSRQIVFTSKAAKPSPTYSPAVKAAGLVFVCGTAPIEPETGQIKGTTIQEQTQQRLTNIAAILEATGTSMEKIASATIILADEDDFAGMNEEWMRWFPSNPPARQGSKLPARIPGSRFQSPSSLRLKKNIGQLGHLVLPPKSGATDVDVSFDEGSVCDGYSRDNRIPTHRPLTSNVKVIACLTVPSNLSKHNYFIRCQESLGLTGSSNRNRLSGKRNRTFNSTIDMHKHDVKAQELHHTVDRRVDLIDWQEACDVVGDLVVFVFELRELLIQQLTGAKEQFAQVVILRRWKVFARQWHLSDDFRRQIPQLPLKKDDAPCLRVFLHHRHVFRLEEKFYPFVLRFLLRRSLVLRAVPERYTQLSYGN